MVSITRHTGVTGTVVKGHQVASGCAVDSPFPLGTIAMQRPFFKKEGVSLDNIYPATINVSIAPKTFKLLTPKLTLKNIKWSPKHDAETFSFSPCTLVVDHREYQALIYYPHPDTKIGHVKNTSTLEILSTYIANLPYGTEVTLKLDQKEVILDE
jgi:hypothetical protein